MSAGQRLEPALQAAAGRLTRAGVPSPRADAELLAAHLLGMGRGELVAAAIRGACAPEGLDELIDERCRRVPLQHLTGTVCFRGIDLEVGPGVFIPRPETEDVAGAAIAAANLVMADRPEGPTALVVDLCAGSGAIAAAVAREVPGSRVHAVEVNAGAHAWAQRNLAGTSVSLHLGDATVALPDLVGLEGTVDVVVTNPPYIPDGMVPVDPEVSDHDPPVALYGRSADGLAVPLAVASRARVLLRPGGRLVMEHAEGQQPTVIRALQRSRWAQVQGHRDLAGRNRYVVAVRVDATADVEATDVDATLTR